MNGTISLKEALEIIEQKDTNGEPIPFDITYRTLNRQSKTGGSLKTVNQAVILTGSNKQNLSQAALKKIVETAPKARKNPNHFENRTRNLKKPNGEKFKVHIRFIISINNQKVVY